MTDDLGELGELLAPILENPETMEKLRKQAEELGFGDMFPPGGAQTHEPNKPHEPPKPHGSDHSAELPAMMAKLAPLLSGLSGEDDSTRLLAALRPFLSEKRGKRLDEAGRILSIARVARLLPELGVIGRRDGSA